MAEKNPLEKYRTWFNESFTEAKYAAFLQDLHPFYDLTLDFRIAETPVFIGREFKAEMLQLFEDVKGFLQGASLKAITEGAVPEALNMPNETDHPCFLAIDFAVCQREDGSLFPQLIELQGVASIYHYQRQLAMAYQRHFQLPDTLSTFLEGMDHERYLQLLSDLILAGESPEQVILLDILPHQQKTRIDFHYATQVLGIPIVCVTELRASGNKLYYEKNGKRIPIKRIYNRMIPDEYKHRSKMLPLQFDWRGGYEVVWLDHPNWFFRVSKYLLPFMSSRYVPKSQFLHKLDKLPENLEDFVLKPLFSFAGAGLHFDVTHETVEHLPNPQDFILQQKVAYAPFLPTLDVPAKVEIRMLCIWTDEIKPMLHLARLSKGKIIGVDFNKDRTWVGSSAVFFEQ